MNKIIKYIYVFLLKPFRTEFYVLFILLLFVCLPDVIGYFFYGKKTFFFGIYMGMHGFIMSYAVVLLAYLFRPKLRNACFLIILILGGINFIVDSAVHITCKTRFTKDMVAILLGTNINEGIEFIKTYFSCGLVAIVFAILFCVLFIYSHRVQINKLGHKLSNLLIVILILSSCCVFGMRSNNWGGVFLNKIVTLVTYKSPPNLRDFYSSPSICITKDKMPQCVLLIIGESFSKSHSSLYGYDKNTNPNLSKLVLDTLLYVHNEVTAPALTTIKAFQAIMSTYRPEYGNEKNWYECTTLLEIMSLAGYKTTWISNQSPSGMYDNIVAKYAELCDTTIWVGSKYKGIQKTDLDGEILNVLRPLSFKDGHQFVVIHLMGSHYDFRDRYPKSYEYFVDDDYLNVSKEQANVLAHYDNSILYNDYVVSEIFNYFADEEVIGFYLSDHGIDLFDSSNTYYGHARYDNAISVQSASKVPFVVYSSALFKSHFPEEINDIESLENEKYRSDELMDIIFDLIGIKVEGVNDNSREE